MDLSSDKIGRKIFDKIILDQLCDRIVTQAANARSTSILPYQFLSNVYATVNRSVVVAVRAIRLFIGRLPEKDKLP